MIPPPLTMEYRTAFKSSREGASINMIVVHSISEWIWWPEEMSGEEDRYVPAIEWLTKPVPGHKPVSAHAYISPLGAVHALCDETDKAWHAGVSKFGEETDLNRVSLGVELAVEGQQDYGAFTQKIKRPDCYTGLQYRALGWLIYEWMCGYPKIRYDRVVAHSTIAGDDVRGAGRGKRDPGDGFSWREMWDEVEKWEHHGQV